MNVDIRVVVDVTEGNVDVFFSPESQMFIVNTNKVKILLKILLKLFLVNQKSQIFQVYLLLHTIDDLGA